MLPIGFTTNPYLISSPYYASIVAAVPLVPTAVPAAVPSSVILPSERFFPSLPFAYYGYDMQRVIQNENYKTVESIIDTKIKDRVHSQIEQYERDRNEFREKYESCCEIECPRRRPSICYYHDDSTSTNAATQNHENRELTLEEKVELIRRELNLPRPAEARTTFDKRTQIDLDYEWDHRYVVTEDKPKVMYPSAAVRGRPHSATRVSSALPLRSRSPSLGSRPIWKPTGANDYPWTHSTRSSILSGEYKSLSTAKEPENKNVTSTKTSEVNEIPVFVTRSEKPKVVKFVDYAFEPSYTVYEAKKTTHYSELPRETTLIKVRDTVYPQIAKPRTTIEDATSVLGSGYVKYAPMTINIKDSKGQNTFNFVGPL